MGKTGIGNNRSKNQGDPLAYLGEKTLIGAAGVLEGIGDTFTAMAAGLSGNEKHAKHVFEDSWTGKWRKNLDEEFNPNEFMSFFGSVGEGIGQSSAFLLDLLVPYLGTGVFFTGIMGSSVGSAVQQTGELGWHEIGYGVTVGAAEAALEKFIGAAGQAVKTIGTKGATTVTKSMGKAVVGRAARNGIGKRILSESAGEFAEEFLGDFVDVGLQKFWQINPDAQIDVGQALYSGMVGAVSGAAMGGTVELTNATHYISAGNRVIRNGNTALLLDEANAVADAFGTMGTGKGRTRMNQFIASVQGSVDAYNKLSPEAKQGTRGALYLGEIQGALFGLQSTRGVMIASEQIKQKPEKFADYASKVTGKVYTAQDVLDNKDGILDALAVRKFAGEFMSPSTKEREIQAKMEAERKTAPEAPVGAVMEEMGDPFEDVIEPVTVRSIDESGEWDGESATFADGDGVQTTVLASEDGTYDLYLGEIDAENPDANRLEGLTRKQAETILRERGEGSSDTEGAEKHEEAEETSPVTADNEPISTEVEGDSEGEVDTAEAEETEHREVVEESETEKDEDEITTEVNEEPLPSPAVTPSPEGRATAEEETEETSSIATDASPTAEGETETVEDSDSLPELSIDESERWDGEDVVIRQAGVSGSVEIRRVQDGEYELLGHYRRYELIGHDGKGEVSTDIMDGEAVRDWLYRMREKFAAHRRANSGKRFSLKKVLEGDAQSAEAAESAKKGEEKEAAEKPAEKRSPSAEVASVQDRARKMVAEYDLQSAEVRYAIEQMYRSADKMGVAADVADAAAHLIAVLGDVEIRFDKGLKENGVIMPLSDGRKLIAISADTDAEGGAMTTLLHEVTHYMEGREGYEQLSKLAMEQYSEEKAEAIRKRYREYADAHGLTWDDAFISEEVTAEAVGELLSKGKYIARLRDRHILVRAAGRLWGYVKALKGKNVNAYRAALRLQDAMNHCLARTKEEAAEVVKRYSFKGYAEDGKGIYESNFPMGTPKKAKAERILRYIRDVWSKKPIALTIEDAVGKRVIEARFDPTYDETTGKASDASKLMGGNRHGTSSEQRVTLDLADDYYQIASESTYNYSKDEVGKATDPHKDVKQWHYFINDIYFAEYGSSTLLPYRVTINVKEKSNGNFVYSFSAEKTEETSTQRTLHAAVSSSGEATTNGDLSTDNISQSDGVVNRKYSLRANNDIAELYSELHTLNERERAYAEQWKKAQASIIGDEEYLVAIEEHAEAKSLAQKRAVRQRMKTIEEKYGIPQLVAEKSEIKDRQKEIRDKIDELTKAAAEEAEIEAIRKSGKTAEEYHRSLAVKEFGYTSDFNEAGYLLPTGRMLNFSGEKGRHTGERGQDHRAVGIVYANAQGTAALIKFMGEGNIRIMAETPGLDVMQGIEPTAEQYAKIRTYVREMASRGFFNVDITGTDGRTIGSLSYEGRVNPDRIVNDIKAYYQTGEIREQSAVDRFRYSLRKDETDAERAERLEKDLKRVKSLNKQLKTDYDFYQKHSTNPGDVRAWWAVQMEGYTGSAERKEMLTNRMVKNAGRIDRLLQGTAGKNAQAIKSALDKELDEIATEIAYHQGVEQLSEDVKEIRAYLRSTPISISEEYREDFQKEGGYDKFRKRNFGVLKISNKGTPVESVYPELTELFGEAAFPSSIKNPADQLKQISKSVRGTVHGAIPGETGAYIDYPELQSKLKEKFRDDLTALMRRQQKGYNPVWNLNTLHGNYAPYTAFYTYRSVQKIMDEADRILREEAEALGYRREYGAMLREIAETDILRRMNAGNRSDMSKLAGLVLDSYLKVQRFREFTDEIDKKGRRKVNTSIKPLKYGSMKWESKANVEERLRSKIIELLSDERLGVIGEVYQWDALSENAGLRDEIESLKAQAALAGKIKSLSDLAKGRTKPSERVSLDEMNAVIENFSKIVYKGRISAKRTREFVLWLNGYLASQKPTGTISYLKESLSDGVLDTLTEFATTANGKDVEAGALGMFELKALNDLFYEIRHAYDNYGMVKLDGVWKDAFEVASKGVADAKGSPLRLNKRKTLLEKLSSTVMRFLLQSQDPLRTSMMLEGCAEGGVLSKLIYDVIVGEAMKTSMQMEFLRPFEDFFKEHKGYQEKLATKVLKLKAFADQNGKPFEITLGEAMSFLGLSKREQAKAGLANSDIFFASDEDGVRRAEGGWKRWADMDAQQRISMLTGGISELTGQMEAEDMQFFELVENFFNKVSTETKKRADMDYFGHEMTMEEYYFPIYRDRATIAEEVADAAKRIQNFNNAFNQSFNKQTMKNAEKSLFVANVYDVVTNHATGLAMYATLYRPLQNFNTIWNQQTSGNKNSPESMRSYYKQNVWEGMDAYMRNLFDQVQGITAPKGPLSKVISTVRGNAVIAAFGLNGKIILTQTTSLIAALDVLDVKCVQYGIANGRKANDEVMDRHSLFARTRDYNMEVVKAEGAGDKIHKFGEKLTGGISWMDRTMIRKLWAACQKQVELREGFAIGSEENNIAAGKLLDEVILRTQQTAGMATKSGLMRGGELEKSLTMFSADAMKQLSCMAERMMRYQKYRTDVKNGVPGAQEKLAESKKALAKTGGALIGVAVAGALIAQLFKSFYDRDRRKKPDGSEMNFFEDGAVDAFGNMVSILPLVREVYDMIDSGYEMSDFTLDAFNTIIEGYIATGEDIKRAVAGEYVTQEEIASDVRGLVYSVGTMLGLPARNANNLLEGSLKWGVDPVFSSNTHWGYTSFFRKPSYQKDLDEAIENGDMALAELIIETWLKREKTGVVGDELDILMELYEKGYDILPSSAPSKLSAKQRKEWMAGMEQAQSDVADMVLSGTWQALPEEAKAEAIKKLYRNHKGALDVSVRGKKPYKGTILSEWYGYIPVAEISGMAAATEAYEDENGREVTRSEQIDKVLSQYEGDEVILRYLAGYSTKAAKRMIAAKITEAASTEEELKQLYELFGIDPEEL